MSPTETPLTELSPAPWNPRSITDERLENLCRSIQADPEFLWRRPVLAMADGTIYAGNQRYRAAMALGMDAIPAVVEDVPLDLARERAMRDNAQWGVWEDAPLAELLAAMKDDGADVETLGFDPGDLERLLGMMDGGDGAEPTPDPPTLSDRFMVPPFSVLNAREGWWQERKRAWIAMGIQSEIGRGAPIGGAPMPLDRANATPGGGAMPAADYSKGERGDGRGRAVKGSQRRGRSAKVAPKE